MPSVDFSRRTVAFVNLAHALDHFVLLIFPTAVIAIASELHRGYGELIGLSTGAFVAFGLFSLPIGWLADRFGHRRVLTSFFFGYGAACFLVAASSGLMTFTASLLLLGIFSAIYHPIGSAMIAANAGQLGRALGVNGVWGNLGAAMASGVTAALTVAFGWRVAFMLPGAILIVCGLAYRGLVRSDSNERAAPKSAMPPLTCTRSTRALLLGAFVIAIMAGGMTFNIITIALPKIIDEKLGYNLPVAYVGWITTAIFVCGAVTQVLAGGLTDRLPLPKVFVGVSIMQPVGLAIASASRGAVMLFGVVMAMSAIYGQVVINDAMISRYAPHEARNRAYSVRYFLGFTVSGLSVPLIAALHRKGGFEAVLLTAAIFGAAVFGSALLVHKLLAEEKRAASSPRVRSASRDANVSQV